VLMKGFQMPLYKSKWSSFNNLSSSFKKTFYVDKHSHRKFLLYIISKGLINQIIREGVNMSKFTLPQNLKSVKKLSVSAIWAVKQFAALWPRRDPWSNGSNEHFLVNSAQDCEKCSVSFAAE
jgi:hypothetical protein